MQIVIDISKEDYTEICKCAYPNDLLIGEVIYQVRNSVPLPKGHGDLVTKEQMIELVEFYQLNPQHFDFVDLIDEIKDEKPIIEADKE